MDEKKIKTTITRAQDQTDKLLEMQKTIDAYKQDGEEMGKEILALKRSINSYKGENTKLRNKNKELVLKSLNLEDALLQATSSAQKYKEEAEFWETRYNELKRNQVPWYKKIFVK